MAQRDHGNRSDPFSKPTNRMHTLDCMGLDVYKTEIKKLLGYPHRFPLIATLTTSDGGKHHSTPRTDGCKT